jgi:DNA-binding CsgD family transcriptional regulator
LVCHPGAKQTGIGAYFHGATFLVNGKLLETEIAVRHTAKLGVRPVAKPADPFFCDPESDYLSVLSETMMLHFIRKHKIVLLYGMSMAILLILLKWLELRFIIYDYSFEIYAGAIAIVFTALGIWLAIKLTKPKVKTVVVEKPVYMQPGSAFVLNEKECTALGISKRELEVLERMAGGLSNQQIADQLYVSLSTVKTHSARIFEKLEVERRTQAVEKAKRLGLIP